MDEQREIDPRVRKANAFIKSVMIQLEIAYPDEMLSEDAIREKCFFRSKLMDCIHKIIRIQMKEKGVD